LILYIGLEAISMFIVMEMTNVNMNSEKTTKETSGKHQTWTK
jgi:hypothetical protein